jgi:hypothetical protein
VTDHEPAPAEPERCRIKGCCWVGRCPTHGVPYEYEYDDRETRTLMNQRRTKPAATHGMSSR